MKLGRCVPVAGAFATILGLGLGLGLAPGTARADCPTTPDDAVCRPWRRMLLPSAIGALYSPHGLSGTYLGGGVELAVLAWSDNSSGFGPGQGRIRLDASYLASTARRTPAMVMYRGGAQLAFERNASRAFLIPYYAADLGGLWSEATGRRWYVDAGLGLYLVHLPSVIVDLEVTGFLPFSDPGTMVGLTSRLGLSFAFW